MSARAKTPPLMEPPRVVDAAIPEQFAIFEDGPFLRRLQRVPLLRRALDTAAHRAALIVAITWLPLLLLSLYEGHAAGGAAIPFLLDYQTHLRLLVTVPLCVIGADQAHVVITAALKQFIVRDIVHPAEHVKFAGILRDASHWNRSIAVRLGLVVLLVVVGPGLWRYQMAIRDVSAWYGYHSAASLTQTLAGRWFMWVANPTMQYVELLWVLRMLVYTLMLGRISALDLHLIATHPDRAGGVAFLATSTYAFRAFVFGQGAWMAGVLANRVLHDHRMLPSFRMDIAVAALLVTGLILGPLCVFTPKLLRVKRRGYAEYGTVANGYVRDFEDAWVFGRAVRAGRKLLGTSDIQSLADLANAYDIVNRMRPVPFSGRSAVAIAVAFLLPMAPLLLTMFRAEELLDTAIRSFVGF